ncbi:MAG: PIG-L deacetylase family protein [Candidatus Excrementavichristensenella sp.]|jgi:LmbE family N-acetylglucosaminyl deacetylase
MREYHVLDIETKRYGGLEILFPGWDGGNERLLVYSPHDDDAIIGAGYAMRAALDDGAEVHIIIVCSGNCGYSTPDQKATIVETRRKETLECYKAFGIPEENIIFMGYSDFSALNYIGWNIGPGREGHFRRSVTEIRKRRITRMLVPNHYHEHVDHIAAYMMGAYDAPQVGDAHTVDWAEPHAVISTAQYSVWAELDPEDALLHHRDPKLRGDTVLIANGEVEREVQEGLEKFVSQTEIIADLMIQRKMRRLADGRYIEVYLRIDPRPKLDFEPYKRFIENL